MPSLFIRALSLPQPVDAGFLFRCEWLILDADGECRERGGGDYFSPAAADAQGLFFGQHQTAEAPAANAGQGDQDWARNPANVVVFVPAQQVLSVSCTVPGRSASQMRRALPYVVEEFIASDIDDTHLACGNLRPAQPVRCGMIDDQLLRDWLQTLAGLGIRPGYLLSEVEMLPAEPKGASLLIENGQVLLRTENQAVCIDRHNLVAALSALDLDRLTLIDGRLTDIETSQLDFEVCADRVAEIAGEGGVLSYFAQRWQQSEKPLNLLQGDHAPVMPKNVGATQWRLAGWLGAIWLTLGLVGMAVTAIWSSMRADALEDDALAIYRDIFPQDRTATVQNIRRRMQAQLGERPAMHSRPMLTFTEDLATVMDSTMTLVGIDYNAARGEFATEILVRRYDDVERVREALAARDVEAEIASAEQVEEAVRARLRIRAY